MQLADKLVGLGLFIASFLFLLTMHRFVYGGVQSTVGPLFFPKFVMTLVVVLSLVLVFKGFLRPAKKEAAAEPEETEASPATFKDPLEEEEVSNLNIVIYLGLLVAYMGMMHLVGFIVSTPIVMMVVAIILKGRNYIAMALMSIFFSVTLYYVALKLMKIMLPAGILFE